MSPDRKKKNRRFRGQSRTLGLLLLAGLFALNTLVALLSLSQKRYDVSVGQTATETIYATRAIEDTEATEALRQAARDAVQTVYALDKSLAESLEEGVRSFFTALASLRAEAAGIRAASAPVDASGNALTDSRSWQVVIAQDQLLSMLAKLPMPLTDAALGYALLSASDEELLRLEDIVVSKLSVQLSKGVSEDGVAAVRSEASRELQVTTLSTWLKELGDLLYGQYLQPTLLEDETATARAREEAAAAVTPVNIARGAAIVREGDTVSSGQMATLTALGLVRGVNENKLFPAGVAGCLLVAYALFAWYLYIRLPELLGPNKQMFMLLLIVGISVLLEWLCFLLEPRVTPAILAVLLTAVLLSREAAQAVNILLAFAFGMMAGGNGSGLLGSASSLSIMASLLGGQAAIHVAVGNDRRGSLIAAGATCGGVGALVVLSGCAMLGESFNNTLVHTGLVLLPPVVLSVFCVGMLSVWENVFDVVTSARLHELLNGNHPLLRKMMTVAPGTFHHSMMAASLAEGAAEAIGANALLARAGATYHDVGKLRRPSYFSENQTDGNIHDTLPPAESAAFIIAHQRDAEPLLQKYRIPAAVRAIAAEHHGTTLVAYFYFKARQAAGDRGVEESAFRYPGPRPSTRESAIVMLADSCEAAVRSLGDATSEQVAEMVHKVIRGKLDDGQFADCPITMQELARVEKSFLVTFSGILHDRVRYPDEEEELK